MSGPDTGFTAIIAADSTGAASTVLASTGAGTDLVEAWIDVNNNGAVDPGEPSNSTTVRWNPAYVAFGDSLTTGYSQAVCAGLDDRTASPWGCNVSPAARPYPDRVATALGLTHSDSIRQYRLAAPGFPPFGLDRVGIWGYSTQEANAADISGHDAQGPWMPQLAAIRQAGNLVTGALGVDDIRFSYAPNIMNWLKLYALDKSGSFVVKDIDTKIAAISSDLDALFKALDVAKANGAQVVIVLYYNPYDTSKPICGDLKNVTSLVVNTLDGELAARANAHGFLMADPRPAFSGHGSGSNNPYVFGKSCKFTTAMADWTIDKVRRLVGLDSNNNLSTDFDPHPNDKGTKAMANAVLAALGKTPIP
jgi:lysophospholipase L1-like esterase